MNQKKTHLQNHTKSTYIPKTQEKNRTIREADWISLPRDKINKRKDKQRRKIVLTEKNGVIKN